MRRESCIDGYDEALALERKVREDAFLSETTSICGIKVHHVTPFLLARLFRMETPFISGGDYTLTAAIQFLWAVSVDFKEDDAEALDAFIVSSVVANNPGIDDLYDGIDEYVNLTFMDAPGGTGAVSVPYICSIAWMIHCMAKDPHRWPDDKTMRTPIRRIYQYMKCMLFDRGEILRNPISDKIKEDWLLKLREQQGQN